MTKRELAALILDAIKHKVDDVTMSHDDALSQLDVEVDGRTLTVLITDELDDEDYTP